MSGRHEWDIDFEPASRVRRGSPPVYAPPRRGWADPRVTHAVDIFWRAVWGSLGAVLAIVLSVVGLGALWLFSAAVSGF